MDATTDQGQEFIDEAREGTDDRTDGAEVELVEGEDAPGLELEPSGSEAAAADTRSRSDEGLSDGEKAEVLADNMLSDEARYSRWQGRRPPVCHLQPAVVFPPGGASALPLFDVGDRIVVEMRTRLLDSRPDPLDPLGTPRFPWLRTKVVRVTFIDDETGLVRGTNEDNGMATRTEHFRFNDPEVTAIYLAPRVGIDPFDVSAILAQRKEEQRRAAAVAANLPGAPPKRGRGRPPGAKNRPKAEIEAERAQIKQLQDERRARRKAKRAGL